MANKVMDGAPFDAKNWLSVFAAAYFSSMADFHSKIRFPIRFPGKSIRLLASYRDVFYTALGFVIGCREEALRLARVQIKGHHLRMFDFPEYNAAAQCVLRIFADHLREPIPLMRGEALTQPVYNALVTHWRDPDAESLAPLLLAACDEHTWRCANVKPYGWEFDFQEFCRTPVEILLVFKLREDLGLTNPKLDHPLMNTAMGVLPQEVCFAPDGLIGSVAARMRADGFDDEAILSDFVSGVPKT